MARANDLLGGGVVRLQEKLHPPSNLWLTISCRERNSFHQKEF
jgi:hypothetical protein